MRNHEVTVEKPLLNANGSLREPGWSRKLVQKYDRRMIRAPKFRIKEWDYYLILAQDFGIALTVSDDGYIGLQSATFFDFTEPSEHTETILSAMPMGKLNLPTDSSGGDTVYRDKRLAMKFTARSGERRVRCCFKDFLDGKTLQCDIRLEQPDDDTLVIATPFRSKKTAFYYNQKINCMRASGFVRLGGKEYAFNPETDFGTLDWGRGVWTYDNTWYWGSGNGIVNGKRFGFNLGYGFGDTSAASENIVFYDGVGHKLDDVTFIFDPSSYTAPWKFTSSDGRFEADFEPIIDRAAKINAGVILSDQHQVFGRMSGKAVLDDGTELDFKDILCFAEHVHNKY